MSGSLTKSDQSFMRQFSMLIAGLSVLTVLLISLGWAIYNHEPKETNPNAPQQVEARIAPVGAVYSGNTGRAAIAAAAEAAAKAAAAWAMRARSSQAARAAPKTRSRRWNGRA